MVEKDFNKVRGVKYPTARVNDIFFSLDSRYVLLQRYIFTIFVLSCSIKIFVCKGVLQKWLHFPLPFKFGKEQANFDFNLDDPETFAKTREFWPSRCRVMMTDDSNYDVMQYNVWMSI